MEINMTVASGSGWHKPTVGWIGLGKMGLPIVDNLLKAGFEIAVYDLDARRTTELARRGARAACEIAALAAWARAIFSIIPDDAALREVALGHAGAIANARDDAVYVDMSTVSPAVSAEVRIAARHRAIDFIAAPVSGSTVLAEKAQLTVFASGPQAAFARVMPVLETISARQYYVGADDEGRWHGRVATEDTPLPW
jgi:3-hydroxyisobutyrate dehydrogenase-like beta-hydroxyacid dehydrogenase